MTPSTDSAKLELAKWEAYAARLQAQGKGASSEHKAVMRRLQGALRHWLSVEEFYQQLKEEGDKEWTRLMAIVESGKHPTWHELASAIVHYGVGRVSPGALYVANRMIGAIKPPQGNSGRPRAKIADFDLRVLYDLEYEGLRILWKSNRSKYRELYKNEPPSVMAQKKLSKEFGVGRERIRKLAKKSVVLKSD